VTVGSSAAYKVNLPEGMYDFVRSPKGKFTSCGDGILALLDMETGSKVDLVTFPEGQFCLVLPVWSPDEQYVLFGIGKPPSGGLSYFTIQAVNIETKEVTLIKKAGRDIVLPHLTGLDWFAPAP